MDALTIFGLVAVTAMLMFYALEDHSPWFILASLELVCWRQSMASCKAPGPSGSSKPFGRVLQCTAGELGRAFMSTRPRAWTHAVRQAALSS
jgi:hypothetical protein